MRNNDFQSIVEYNLLLLLQRILVARMHIIAEYIHNNFDKTE